MTKDPLLDYRTQFPALENCVHMVTHSLGCVPGKARDYLLEFYDLWHQKSVTAWNDWLPAVEAHGDRLGKIMNAPEGTVTIHTNVAQAMAVVASCFDYTPEKNKIVYSDMNFPSVAYLWKAEERRGAEVVTVEGDGVTVDTQKILDAIDERTLVVPISHVLFRSAAVQDAKAIAARAKEVGAHVVLDCYQSLGTYPVDVQDFGVSFACGGSVKWVNGGPGVGYLYVRPDLMREFEPRVTGWFGHKKPFGFVMGAQDYADDRWRYMNGTPAVAAVYHARAGADLINEIGVAAIRNKSLRLTGKIVEWVDELGFTLNSPRDGARRGGSVVFDFEGAEQVVDALNDRRFFCDHRPGAGVRVSPHYYTKDEEIDLLFEEIKKIQGR